MQASSRNDRSIVRASTVSKACGCCNRSRICMVVLHGGAAREASGPSPCDTTATIRSCQTGLFESSFESQSTASIDLPEQPKGHHRSFEHRVF